MSWGLIVKLSGCFCEIDWQKFSCNGTTGAHQMQKRVVQASSVEEGHVKEK